MNPSRCHSRKPGASHASRLCWFGTVAVLAAATSGPARGDDPAGHRPPRLILQHEDTLGRGLALSPDGRLLAAAAREGNVLLWDLDSGRLIGSFFAFRELNAARPASLAFSPDGRTLLGACGGSLRSWEITGAEARLSGHAPLRHGALAQWLVFSPDRTVVAGAGRGGVTTWDVATGQIRDVLDNGRDCSALAFSPDGGRLAAGVNEKVGGRPSSVVKVWELATSRGRDLHERKFGRSVGHISSLSFSADGSELADANASGPSRVWDLASGRVELRVAAGEATYPGERHGPHQVAYCHGGRVLAMDGGNTRTIEFWDVSGPDPVRLARFAGPRITCRELAVSADGGTLATGDGFITGLGAQLIAWDVARILEAGGRR